jgi:Ca2+-binding RTX toxin-like protein
VVQALNDGDPLTDTFTVKTQDGTEQVVTINITGSDDAPIIVDPGENLGLDPNDHDDFAGGSLYSSLLSPPSALNGDNIIRGTTGADTIDAKNGDDQIYGLAGDDSIEGGQGIDTIYGGSGNDTIEGIQDDDTIYGGSGNDTISGNEGDDIIIGGYGKDALDGGQGSDTFVFLNTKDTGDIVANFTAEFTAGHNGDKLDFSDLANSSGQGTFELSNDTSVHANSISYFQSGDDTKVWVDTDGDTSTVEMEITLSDVQASNLTEENFVV